MIVDNRNLPPLGTMTVRGEDGSIALAMWVDSGTARAPVYGHKFGSEKVKCSILKDFTTDCFNDNAEAYLKYPYYDIAARNRAENIKMVSEPKRFNKSKTVILCGGGPSAEDFKDAVNSKRSVATVISLSRTQKVIPGDYCVAIEPNENDVFDGADFQNTHAHLMLSAHTETAKKPWKEISWADYGFFETEGVSRYHAHENATCIALEFAVKRLGAEKIVMIGMEHPIATNYYWHGIELQGMCWYAAQKGIEIWNCTPNTSVLAGVVLSTFDETL